MLFKKKKKIPNDEYPVCNPESKVKNYGKDSFCLVEDINAKKEEKQQDKENKTENQEIKKIKTPTGNKSVETSEEDKEEFIDQLKKMQKDAFIKSGIKENEDEKERELIKKIKRKKYNRSVSNEKNEIVKSSKKYYCSGFNMYKDIISKRKKNANSKK